MSARLIDSCPAFSWGSPDRTEPLLGSVPLEWKSSSQERRRPGLPRCNGTKENPGRAFDPADICLHGVNNYALRDRRGLDFHPAKEGLF